MVARLVNPGNWGYRPKSAFIIGYDDRTFEADTPGEIMTELTGTYSQDSNGLTRWYVRGKFARQWLNTFATRSRRAEIWSGDRHIENNYTPRYKDDPEEVAAFKELEWTVEPAAKIDIETDRTLYKSLLEIGLINILEREDVHYFRRTSAWDEVYALGRTKCELCRFYRVDENGQGRCIDNGQNVQPDAPIGWFCQSFAPLHPDDRLEDGKGAKYISIGPKDIHLPPWQTKYIEE